MGLFVGLVALSFFFFFLNVSFLWVEGVAPPKFEEGAS